jgi:hypothetical protein
VRGGLLSIREGLGHKSVGGDKKLARLYRPLRRVVDQGSGGAGRHPQGLKCLRKNAKWRQMFSENLRG